MRKNLYKFAILFMAICGFTSLQGQLNLAWDEMGPNNLGSHCRAIAVGSNGTVWAGSVGGGLWKSTNNGLTWFQVPGVADNLAVSSIAVSGNNIYVGTGETFFYKPVSSLVSPAWDYDDITTLQAGFHAYAGMPGQGVFVSNDGGATWNHNNGTWSGSSTPYQDDFMSIQKIVTNGSTTFIATLAGLYMSNDAGLATVTKCTGTAGFQSKPITDVEFGAGTTIWASTADSLFKSDNGGASFGTGVNAAVPTIAPPPYNKLGGDRIDIAVAPSDNNVVYVTGSLESSTNGQCTGVFQTTDNGSTWTRVAPYEAGTFLPYAGKGYYNMVLAVNPTDASSFYIGGKTLYKYTPADGLIEACEHIYFPGFIDNYVPTPVLCLAYDPSNPSRFYIGTEKEIVRTDDGGETFRFAHKGFNNGHMYTVTANAAWEVVGSERYRGVIHKYNANDTISYLEFGVDNDDAAGIVRYSNANYRNLIATGTDGGVIRSLSDGETWETFYGYPLLNCPTGNLGADSLIIDRPDSTEGGGDLYDDGMPQFNPFVLDEVFSPSDLTDEETIQNIPVYLYLASRNFVWVCSNPFGTLDSLPSWNRISTDLVSASAPREYITALAVSGDNNHALFIGTNLGKIYRLMNANDPCNIDAVADVVRIDGNTAGMPARWITGFSFDPSNRNNMTITYGAYENSATSYVYITNNALAASAASITFRSIGDNLPELTPVYCSAFHPSGGGLMVGTDIGVFGTTSDYTTASPLTWANESGPMGRVPVYDLYVRPYYKAEIDPDNYAYGADNTIFAATHGRGIFKTRSLISNDKPNTVATDMVVYPNPTTGYSEVQISLSQAASLELEVYSIEGSRIGTLGKGMYAAGNHNFTFDASELNAGIYFVKVNVDSNAGAYTRTLKAIVIH